MPRSSVGMLKPFQAPERERRYSCAPISLRSATSDDQKGVEGGPACTPPKNQPASVRGYAALFESKSENLGWADLPFYEVIERGAFEGCDMQDVVALFNHDESAPLARTGAGLSLGVDERGLWYEFTLLDTTTSRDLAELFAKGVITQSSFAFTVSEDEGSQVWEEYRDSSGRLVQKRTIKKIARLYDVSPVTRPAYADTSVALRALQSYRCARDREALFEPPTSGEVPAPAPTPPPLSAAQRARLRLQTQ